MELKVPRFGLTADPALVWAKKGADYKQYDGPLDLSKYANMLLAHEGEDLLFPLDYVQQSPE
jgi:hypothetical protein